MTTYFINFYIDLLFFGLLGLVVGSFLNVVIYRLPIILNQEWQQQATEFLGIQESEANNNKKSIGLSFPLSFCPHCEHPLPFYTNIPIISFLVQRGKCLYCATKISWQYPLVELITAGFFVILYFQFGLSWAFLGGVIFSCSLLVLTVIDFQTQLLPDTITIPLLWLGLLFNLYGVYSVDIQSAILGAVLAYLSFWLLFHLFKLLTGKEGMGYGDFKFFAALGAWLGLANLPLVLIIAALSGLIFAVIFKVAKSQPMPFGPFLAGSGLLVFMFDASLQSILNKLIYWSL